MNRRRLVWMLVVALCLAAAGLALWLPRYAAAQRVSDLYRRYEHNDYIRATELHNFPVNDTLATDALLLEAATDSAWCELLEDFGMSKELIKRYKTDKESLVGNELTSITTFSIDKNNIKKRIPKTELDSRLTIASHAKRSLCIFMTEDINIKETLFSIEIKKINK